MIKKIDKNKARLKRHLRVRKSLQGTPERPRLNVFRSSKHMYAQIIDDSKAVTIVSASTLDKDVNSVGGKGGNTESARKIGELIAIRAKEAGISQVVFDRGGYLYHGRVKALADAARENGLVF